MLEPDFYYIGLTAHMTDDDLNQIGHDVTSVMLKDSRWNILSSLTKDNKEGTMSKRVAKGKLSLF